jgi:predicted  nucleic acid-binding Zn-ribbon protein
MHSELEKLLQLDQADREIARLRAEIAALPRRVAEIETKLAGINAQLERDRKALKDVETARRKFEGDIQTLQQKISRYRDQMLAVKTNQEYKALGNEIQYAEQEIRLIEDKILEGMLEVESREKQLKLTEAEQKKQQAQVEKEKLEARTRTEQDQKRLAELLPRREELRKQINADTVQHYDRVLKLRGTAIAEAREQYCQACHVMLRPQVYNDIMAGEHVLTCDSCYRILYFNPDNVSTAAAGSGESKEAVTAEATDAS